MDLHPKYALTLSKLQRLNPSAEVLSNVARLMRDTKTEIKDIADVLRTDASLTSDIIRMSNSSYYGQSTVTSNLDEALQRIGIKEAQRLVNLSLARSLYSKSLLHYQLSAYHFWASGVACGLLLESFAKELNIPAKDSYTIGTLHLIGKVILDMLLTDILTPVNREITLNRNNRELLEIGTDYAHAGADLLRRWKFPDEIIAIIENHLEPTNDAPPLAHALNLCVNIIAQTGHELKQPPTTLPEERLATLGLTAETVMSILESVREQFTVISNSLRNKA